MNFYEWDIDEYGLTSKVADDIFDPANNYNGVMFKGKVRKLMVHPNGKVYTCRPILIAGYQTRDDCFSFGGSYSCSMTELKRYLTTINYDEDFRNKLSFISEIEEEMEKERLTPELEGRIVRFIRRFDIRIQRSEDVKSYGRNYFELTLDSFYIKHEHIS